MSDREEITVEIGSHNTLVVDKLFGPHIFANLRITPNTARGCWVIEREWIKSGEWMEWCTIPDQIKEEFTDWEK